MNHNKSETLKFIKNYEYSSISDVVCGIAVPSLNLDLAKQTTKTLKIISQNCYFKDSGAYTGEISVAMLNDINIRYCLVGHSERRNIFHETDDEINKKIHKLLQYKVMTPILCVGETLEIYEQGNDVKQKFLKNQLKIALSSVSFKDINRVIIAYEPIWAIGTGKVATAETAEETIAFLRTQINKLYNSYAAEHMLFLYGGSANPDNTADLFRQKNINGFLVGGASLNLTSFLRIREIMFKNN